MKLFFCGLSRTFQSSSSRNGTGTTFWAFGSVPDPILPFEKLFVNRTRFGHVTNPCKSWINQNMEWMNRTCKPKEPIPSFWELTLWLPFRTTENPHNPFQIYHRLQSNQDDLRGHTQHGLTHSKRWLPARVEWCNFLLQEVRGSNLDQGTLYTVSQRAIKALIPNPWNVSRAESLCVRAGEENCWRDATVFHRGPRWNAFFVL